MPQDTSILLLDPVIEHGRHVQCVLEAHNLQVVWSTRHLSGLVRIDEQSFSLVLATVDGQDIDGLEFCALLRRREQSQGSSSLGVVLIGQDRQREQLVTRDPGMDDYVIEPCLDAEIIWRVKRNLKMDRWKPQHPLELYGLDNTYSKEDLHSVLSSELNRGSRRSDSIGVVLIKVQGWSLLTRDFGSAGSQIVEDIIVGRIRDFIRTYDTLFRIDQGRFAVLLPHSDDQGVLGFMHRIRQALTKILRDDVQTQNELSSVHIEGICASTDISSSPQPDAVREFSTYIVQQAESERFGPELVSIGLGARGMQVDPDPGQAKPS
ncbi:MAG: diguanylate cyclase domain-containing protein [Desulfovermiculus sp.]